MTRNCIAAILLATLLPGVAGSTEPHTEHTFRLSAEEARPAATLEDARWLVGSWAGTAFGQQFEAAWNPASAGTMIGLFKLFGEDGVSFYELILLSVEEGTLSLKVKHFNADFSAWEEKADFVNFRLVRKAPGELHFGGLSFYQRGEDAIDGYIVMRSNEKLTEHHLRYERR